MIWILPAVGGLFLVAFFDNLINGREGLTLINSLIQIIVASLSISSFLFLQYQQKTYDEFMKWLDKSASQIREGGARFRGVLITPKSSVRVFQVTLSCLILSSKLPVRVIVQGPERAGAKGFACSAVTFCLDGGEFPGDPSGPFSRSIEIFWEER